MTWLAVTRSLQLDMANLVTTQDLLFRSHTLSVLSWLPLTTRVVSPINLADNTLPECPSYYVLHICVLIKNFIHVPVKVCLSLESSTDQTLVAKSLLAPRIILPTWRHLILVSIFTWNLPVVSKSIPITAALLPVRVAFRSTFIPLLISQIFIFLSAPAVAKYLKC